VFTDEDHSLPAKERAFVYWLLSASKQVNDLVSKALNLPPDTSALHITWGNHPDLRCVVPFPVSEIIPPARREALRFLLGHIENNKLAVVNSQGIIGAAVSLPPHDDASQSLLYVTGGPPRSAAADTDEGMDSTGEANPSA